MNVVVLLIFAVNTASGVLNVPDAYVFADKSSCELRANWLKVRAARRGNNSDIFVMCIDRKIEQ